MKTKFIYAAKIFILLIFTACNEDSETSVEKPYASTNLESCNCEAEVYSPIAGEPTTFGEGVNSFTLNAYDSVHVFEGDIVLSQEQIVLMAVTGQGNDEGRVKSSGRISLANRWPNKVVPYVINSSLPNTSRVTSAIAHWESHTDYDFVPRTNQVNYVEFVPSTGCASSVGMVGGRQYVYLGSGCTTGNTIHELGHVVGLWHEHTRADRDYFVEINWNNITAGAENNFKYYNITSGGFDMGPFDFGSIMLYPSTAFSSNGQPTIIKKDGSTFTAQRNALSVGDIAGAENIYNAIDIPAPTNIIADHDGVEELTVTWNAVPQATEYWIYTYVYDYINPRFYRISTTNSYHRELKLKYRDTYRIWISSRDANGNTSVLREASYTWK